MALDKLLDKTCKSIINFYKAVGVALAIYTASVPITYGINQNITTEDQTVVFTSGNDSLPIPDGLTAKIIDFFMYTPITLRQNMDGNSVTWVSNGSRAEVLDYLENPDYQNVVFIGHGTGNSFLASDGSVTPNDITSLQIPKRDGELIQHTCGGGGQGLRTALLRNPNNGYGFDSPVRLGTNYSTAWERLFN